MNAVTLIVILCIGELCCGTLSPPERKNIKEKKKVNNKVGVCIIKRIYILYFIFYIYI